MQPLTPPVRVYIGEALASYGFGQGHPFGPDRLYAFWREAVRLGLDQRVTVGAPVACTEDELARFHTRAYIARVQQAARDGAGFLDAGDTPAFAGVYAAACYVVGSVLDGLRRILAGETRRVFVPIAGLHHARRDGAAGFCVFNDIGVAIETLRRVHGIKRVAYVDIDAHHGDGVYYAFEDDPAVVFADTHEDGRFLYPGTGAAEEIGSGAGAGTKLNLPLPPGAGDAEFLAAWRAVEEHLERHAPEFVLFQCGADSLAGDPITHLGLTEAAHVHAAARLCVIADRHAGGRILGFGGGGYNRRNIARAWAGVVAAFVEAA